MSTHMTRLRNRRGVAMLLALWLVVGISVVAMEFALVGRERRLMGLGASDRTRGGAAALGAFAITRARLDQALRNGPQGAAAGVGIRAADPWLDTDSLFSGVIKVDSMDVHVRAIDLGTKLNINVMPEAELKTFLQYVLGDFVEADWLSQSIIDWRDADDLKRIHGAERDDYIKAGMFRLPENHEFRDIEDLLDVKGMSEEVYNLISPYLTVSGSSQINLNSAPVPVLRAIPGMNDEILARILALRSRGQRITSVAQVMPPARTGLSVQVTQAQGVFNAQVQQQLSARATVTVNQVEVTMIVRASPAAKPVRLRVMVQRSNNNGQLSAQPTDEDWR